MLEPNKSSSLCWGVLWHWAMPLTFSLQLCLNLRFLQSQSLKVNQRQKIGASNYHSWACTQPYLCTWPSRFLGICWGVSVHLQILYSSALPFKLLFIVCPNCYPSSKICCDIAVGNPRESDRSFTVSGEAGTLHLCVCMKCLMSKCERRISDLRWAVI